ncbi:MAG: hypothetical protein IH948_00940 [Bacteroidetes bacterium]|nr:hypothetical protein [Bacteroidota bacterium]
MKKNILLAIIAAVVALAAVYFLSTNKSSSEDLSDFSIEDTESVTKIFMADQHQNQITVVKQPNGKWIVNNEFFVRPDAIEIVLTTLKNIRIKRPTSIAERETIFKHIASNSVKVEIYQQDELVKVCYVGSATKESKGTFMLLSDPETGKNAKYPYVVNLPGFIGNVKSRFFTDINKWRDVSVFDYPIGTLKQVKIDYPSKENGSFTINIDKGKYEIRTRANELIKDIDPSTVKDYLNLYSHTAMEGFINFMEIADSTMASNPYFQITAADVNGDITVLKAHQIYSRDYESDDPKATRLDLDRMYGTLTKNGRSDFILIQYFTFDNLTVTTSKFTGDSIVDK